MLSIFISIILIFLVFFFILSLAVYILSALGLSKMFKKANQDGWPAWIPIYNTYVLCKITGVNLYWFWIVIALYFLTFIPFVGILTFICSIYFHILLSVSTARSFGKNDAYAIGLFFLPPIFYMIFGYGSSTYLGARPMEDVIFNHEDTNTTTSDSGSSFHKTISEKNISHYCVYCGKPLADGDKFCSNCGKEV